MSIGKAYDYPLRPHFMAQVVLPRDMTLAEADRVCAFLMTLPIPNPPPPQNGSNK